MRTKRVAVLLAAVTVAAGAAGFGGVSSASSIPRPSTGKVVPLLRVGVPYDVSTIDTSSLAGSGYQITELGLDSLMNIGPHNQVQPGLATSVTHPTPTTYVYHLRHNVKFWNGDPLTATDVAYSLNYWRRPGSSIAYVFPAVTSIAATNRYRITVTLPGPNPAWVYTPADNTVGIFEAKFAETHKSTFGKPGTLIMGSGPWEFDSLDPTTGAQLSANPHWWGGRVPIKHISFTFFSSETSLALAFRAGEIDLDPQIDDAQSFAATSGSKLLSVPSCENGFVTMNMQTAPWNDVHVRRAVAYALDRRAAITADGGYATPLSTFITPEALASVASSAQISHLLGSIDLYPYSLAQARQQMAQSAYSHGVNVTIWVVQYGSEVNVAQVVVSELQKIGINAQLKIWPNFGPLTDNETGPARKRATAVWSGGCIDPDVSGYDFYLGSWNLKQGEWNIADWAPPGVDKLLREGETTTNQAKRFADYSKVVRQMSAAVPYVPLFLHDFSVALSPKFTIPGFKSDSFWHWLDGDYGLELKPAS